MNGAKVESATSTPHHTDPPHTTPTHHTDPPRRTTPHHDPPRRAAPRRAAPRRAAPHHDAPRRATTHHDAPPQRHNMSRMNWSELVNKSDLFTPYWPEAALNRFWRSRICFGQFGLKQYWPKTLTFKRYWPKGSLLEEGAICCLKLREGSPPSAGTALRRTAQNFALFFKSPIFYSFFPLLGVFLWNLCGVFEGRGLKCSRVGSRAVV